MARKPKLYLIDGHSQIFRAYYAPASFRNRSQAAGAVYIFTRMLVQLIQRGKPDAIICALDSKGIGGVRNEMFPEYKANRDPMPEDLAEAMPTFLEILDAMGVSRFEGGEYEADDVIGTLSKQGEAEGYEVRIVTRDKDLKQLLTDNVSIYDIQDGFCYGPDELEADLGLKPEQFIDYLALMGDKVDNIPGAKGIGPKTAQALLLEHGSLEAVLEAAPDMKKSKRKENLIAFTEQAPLSKQLATVICDMDVGNILEQSKWHGLEKEDALPKFKELGFNSLMRDLGWLDGEEAATPAAPSKSKPSREKAAPKSAKGPSQRSLFESAAVEEKREIARAEMPADKGDYQLINSQKAFDAFLKKLKKQKEFSFDTETNSLNALEADLVGMSFSWKAGSGHYVALMAPEGEDTCDREKVLAALKPILEDPKVGKIGQNLKFDIKVLVKYGIELRGVVFDTMIAAYLADNSRQQVGMNQLANELLSYECMPITALIGTDKKKQLTMDQVPSQEVATYASEDADIALRLATVLRGDVEALGLSDLAANLEMPLVEVLAGMEARGITIDLEYLDELKATFGAKIEELTQACYAAAEREFKIGSPKQLAEVLFDELGLEPKSKTSTGKRSTSVDVLESLREVHELPGLVLEYRKFSKLVSTYVDSLPKLADKNARVHTTFRQAVSTGRLASVDPNVQNIPVRTEEGKLLRKVFKAKDAKHSLIVADYSQIELRILAHLCGDERLRAAFIEGRDIHRAVAAEVNGVDEKDVDSDMRSKAKAIHFGILYGQGPHGLSQALGISRGEAKGFIDAYFDRFPKVGEFKEQIETQVQEDEYVTTIMGRRRRISGAQDRNRMRQAAALRQAFNTVVQGSAADLIKMAMLRVHSRIRDDGLPYELLIQVHDELILEAPKKDEKKALAFLKKEMGAALELEVPLVVDAAAGPDWLNAKA